MCLDFVNSSQRRSVCWGSRHWLQVYLQRKQKLDKRIEKLNHDFHVWFQKISESIVKVKKATQALTEDLLSSFYEKLCPYKSKPVRISLIYSYSETFVTIREQNCWNCPKSLPQEVFDTPWTINIQSKQIIWELTQSEPSKSCGYYNGKKSGLSWNMQLHYIPVTAFS